MGPPGSQGEKGRGLWLLIRTLGTQGMTEENRGIKVRSEAQSGSWDPLDRDGGQEGTRCLGLHALRLRSAWHVCGYAYVVFMHVCMHVHCVCVRVLHAYVYMYVCVHVCR